MKTKTIEAGDTVVTIREITSEEYPVLEDFLYNAIYLAPGEEMPPLK